MQDMRAIGGGARFFGGGDRRLRQHNQQALKCPRCDSFNTKFCYYNNYNLSQPRHFCKSCRRYWTKGGVLRNVPVGGGCRKTKRSKNSKTGAAAAASGGRSSNARSSSSESSSLTAATTVAATPTSTVAEQVSAVNNTPSSSVNFSDSRFLTVNPNYDYPVNRSTGSHIFPKAIGSFANLTTSSGGMVDFSIANIPTTSYGQAQKGKQAPEPENPSLGTVAAMEAEELKVQEITAEMSSEGMKDSALGWGSGGGSGGGGGGDPELFDLTAAVDPAYWSQPHWTDGGDQSLNFLS